MAEVCLNKPNAEIESIEMRNQFMILLEECILHFIKFTESTTQSHKNEICVRCVHDVDTLLSNNAFGNP